MRISNKNPKKYRVSKKDAEILIEIEDWLKTTFGKLRKTDLLLNIKGKVAETIWLHELEYASKRPLKDIYEEIVLVYKKYSSIPGERKYNLLMDYHAGNYNLTYSNVELYFCEEISDIFAVGTVGLYGIIEACHYRIVRIVCGHISKYLKLNADIHKSTAREIIYSLTILKELYELLRANRKDDRAMYNRATIATPKLKRRYYTLLTQYNRKQREIEELRSKIKKLENNDENQ